VTRPSTTRFSDRADAYSRHRPGYPPKAFDVLFEGLGDSAAMRVADVGAGTGISTALLAERVAHVDAIEPNAAMRAKAPARSNVTWHDGTAEKTGLRNGSVDVAAAFQAFHWFDAAAAFAEFRRIARRRIGLVQYERDETQTFSNAYAQIVRRYATDDTERLRLAALERFSHLAAGSLQRVELPFAQTLTLEGVLGRVASSSYLPQSGPGAQALRADVRVLFGKFENRGTLEMAMTVHVLTADV